MELIFFAAREGWAVELIFFAAREVVLDMVFMDIGAGREFSRENALFLTLSVTHVLKAAPLKMRITGLAALLI